MNNFRLTRKKKTIISDKVQINSNLKPAALFIKTENSWGRSIREFT